MEKILDLTAHAVLIPPYIGTESAKVDLSAEMLADLALADYERIW